MKKVYIYISSFFVCITVFSFVFYISFRNLNQKTEDDPINTKIPDVKSMSIAENNQFPSVAPSAPAIEVDTVQEALITSDTIYTLQSYYSNKNSVVEEKVPIPSDMIGKTRDELSDYLVQYMENISLNDHLEGLLSFEIVSFSADNIVLRKTYRPDDKADKFFVTAIDKEVVVLYSDKKTVYDYTGIDISCLPPEEQAKLKLGFMVKDQEALYGILENYSS